MFLTKQKTINIRNVKKKRSTRSIVDDQCGKPGTIVSSFEAQREHNVNLASCIGIIQAYLSEDLNAVVHHDGSKIMNHLFAKKHRSQVIPLLGDEALGIEWDTQYFNSQANTAFKFPQLYDHICTLAKNSFGVSDFQQKGINFEIQFANPIKPGLLYDGSTATKLGSSIWEYLDITPYEDALVITVSDYIMWEVILKVTNTTKDDQYVVLTPEVLVELKDMEIPRSFLCQLTLQYAKYIYLGGIMLEGKRVLIQKGINHRQFSCGVRSDKTRQFGVLYDHTQCHFQHATWNPLFKWSHHGTTYRPERVSTSLHSDTVAFTGGVQSPVDPDMYAPTDVIATGHVIAKPMREGNILINVDILKRQLTNHLHHVQYRACDFIEALRMNTPRAVVLSKLVERTASGKSAANDPTFGLRIGSKHHVHGLLFDRLGTDWSHVDARILELLSLLDDELLVEGDGANLTIVLPALGLCVDAFHTLMQKLCNQYARVFVHHYHSKYGRNFAIIKCEDFYPKARPLIGFPHHVLVDSFGNTCQTTGSYEAHVKYSSTLDDEWCDLPTELILQLPPNQQNYEGTIIVFKKGDNTVCGSIEWSKIYNESGLENTVIPEIFSTSGFRGGFNRINQNQILRFEFSGDLGLLSGNNASAFVGSFNLPHDYIRSGGLPCQSVLELPFLNQLDPKMVDHVGIGAAFEFALTFCSMAVALGESYRFRNAKVFPVLDVLLKWVVNAGCIGDYIVDSYPNETVLSKRTAGGVKRIRYDLRTIGGRDKFLSVIATSRQECGIIESEVMQKLGNMEIIWQRFERYETGLGSAPGLTKCVYNEAQEAIPCQTDLGVFLLRRLFIHSNGIVPRRLF